MAKVKITMRGPRPEPYASTGVVGEDGTDWEPGKSYLASPSFARDLAARGIADVVEGEEEVDALGRNPAGVSVVNGDPAVKGGKK